ncbi:MAG: alpha/beta hydrolase [Dorea sp.]|jgi:acetyl esterase|nr:alpha/beta hydrolase [Dorea sp.]
MLQTKEIAIPNEYYDKHATIYFDTEQKPKAFILYFHGGGLLFGTRTDLPKLHLESLTGSGYCIVAYDYPLAPAVKLGKIFEDVCASVRHYIENFPIYLEAYGENAGTDPSAAPSPYFLWGRSAGAYLCLLAGARGSFSQKPAGILSYYGYGFLCDGWFMTPSNYYCSLPAVSESILNAVSGEVHAGGDMNTHYSIYVYARQTGKWADLIYDGRQKFFYLDYTLRTCDKLPCPIFCAHSTGDTDVPYSEFLELCNRYQAQRFVASHSMHDFDRDEKNPVTARLMEATLKFLELKLDRIQASAKI